MRTLHIRKLIPIVKPIITLFLLTLEDFSPIPANSIAERIPPIETRTINVITIFLYLKISSVPSGP